MDDLHSRPGQVARRGLYLAGWDFARYHMSGLSPLLKLCLSHVGGLITLEMSAGLRAIKDQSA